MLVVLIVWFGDNRRVVADCNAGKHELKMIGEVDLGDAHWVGAVKRDAEGSHMQLQVLLCRYIQARFGIH